MNDHSMIDGDLAGAQATTKIEADREGTPSSIGSTPELDAGVEASQEPAQPQKRKGGRKPIYATSEERKQRNRQAQAAFRERRTEYIKQLEANIKQNEELLTSLQENHRRINNDCLMLRYKNSLLERILLEKGIDVQAELEMKQGSPALSTGFMNPIAGLPQSAPSQLQRTALQRQQARLSGSRGFLPKLAPGQQSAGTAAAGGDLGFVTSPHAHPTPSSHASSPSQLSTRSSMAMHQGQSSSPQALARPPNPQRTASAHAYHNSTASGISTHSGASSLPQGLPPPPTPNAAAAAAAAAALQSASSFYPSPFQKHFDQLDQEYDTQTSRSMLDDPDQDDDDDDIGQQIRAPPPPPPPQSQQQQQQPQQPQQSGVADYYTIQHHHPQPPQQQQQQQHHPNQQQQQHHLSHQQQHHHPQQQQPQFHHAHLGFDPNTGAPLLPPTSHPVVAGGGDADEMVSGAAQPFHIDPNDPLLDQDPFGLSASMHYPTAYSFDQPAQGPR